MERVRPVVAHPQSERPSRRNEGSGPGRYGTTGVRGRPRVLIVDDDPDARDLFGWCFRAAGWIVGLAPDAEAALLVATAFEPDAIVMDLRLPGITGHDAIRKLKEDEHTRDVPVVACTAFDPPHAEPLARDAGCDAFVGKPCDPEALRDTLEHLMARRRGSVG
jgi:CheY-like chemotaxis protein